MKPPELIHYKEYIKSPYWTERKRQYFELHPHACEVCGHPDVDLHHLVYGNYGSERDRDLSALCRYHHHELHESIKLRKDMLHQSHRVIDEMKSKWKEMREAPLQSASRAQTIPGSSFADTIDRIARPIWKLYRRFF